MPNILMIFEFMAFPYPMQRLVRYTGVDLEICLPPFKSKQNSTIGEKPKVFDLHFGKDAQPTKIDDLNDSWMVLSHGEIVDINRSDNNSSYRISISSDSSRSFHVMEFPDYPTTIRKPEFMARCK